VDEQALISAVRNKQIAGAAIDVFDIEPLPASHPFRTLDKLLATPHIGYVAQGLYRTFYETPSQIFGSGSTAVGRQPFKPTGSLPANLFSKRQTRRVAKCHS